MKLLRLCAFTLLVFGVVPQAEAQEDAPAGNISGFGVFTPSAPDGLDGGHGFGVSGAWFLSPTIGVEGGFRRQSFDLERTDDNALEGGDLDTNVVTVNVVARVGSGRVEPYVTGGLAFLLNDYATDPAVAAQLAQFNFTSVESVDNAIGFNIGGGVDIRAARSIAVFAEGRFVAANADTAGGLRDDITQTTSTTAGEQSMSSFGVSVGVRVLFR